MAAIGWKIIREVAKRVVTHEAQHVVVAPVRAGERSEQDTLDEQGTTWAVVECVKELDGIASEFPSAFPVEKLRERVEAGCFLVLVCRPAATGPGRLVIGYRLCERGVFSSLGLRVRVSDDIVFTHHAEVLPEYRGQRIAVTLEECSRRYGCTHGVVLTCGVISVSNADSLAAHLRARPGITPRIVATVHRLTFLGGRFVWRTPWRSIVRALDESA